MIFKFSIFKSTIKFRKLISRTIDQYYQMEYLDIIIYSNNGSQNLKSIFKDIFPPNKFLLYEVNRQELLSKSWFNSFRVLVIDCGEGNGIDDLIFAIIKQSIIERKQVLLISRDLNWDLFGDVLSAQITIGHLDDDIRVIQSAEKTHLIYYKNEKSFLNHHEKVSELWDLSKYSIRQIESHHSDLFVFAKVETEILKYLQSVKLCDMRSEDSNKFQYASLTFTNCKSDNPKLDFGSRYKLLKYDDNSNNEGLLEMLSFKSADYFSSLYTENLGKIVLFSEVLLSSYTLMEKFIELGNYHPVVMISYVQTGGRGRGSNKWISPLGCAMFSCLIPISVRSKLGNSMSLLQHIMAVSIVQAINFVCWIDKESVCIKWPNDIYWRDHGKLSGIMSKAVNQGDKYYCLMGCGINVFNKEPSICVYDIINEHNKYPNENMKYPSMETIIAHVLTRLESNILKIQNFENGIEDFKREYYKYWMHQDQHVTVNKDGQLIPGQIIGIDNYGFLQMVPDNVSGGDGLSIVTVHPDGNSFDMMQNLIAPKQ